MLKFGKLAAIAAALAGSPLAVAAANPGSPEATGCKLIRNAAQLQAIGQNATGSFCLANDIDASSIANFVPLKLTNGHFFGNGNAIRNLKIDSSGLYVGLFSELADVTVQDVRLINANVKAKQEAARVGALAGSVRDTTGLTTISNVHISGAVRCVSTCFGGGIVGIVEDGSVTLTDSLVSVAMIGIGPAMVAAHLGGAAGFVAGAGHVIDRTHATGNVSCGKLACYAGGLVGRLHEGKVDRSSAAGAMSISYGAGGMVGGLVGWASNAVIRRSHASGPVSDTVGAGWIAGLIGSMDGGELSESYSVGRVFGDNLVKGGLVASVIGMPIVGDAYWDKDTSTQSTSAVGTGRFTDQMRGTLQSGFGPAWSITKGRSYPFLDDAGVSFTSPLATLVKFTEVFTFLPISQLEESQYKTKPKHEREASRAAVYAMIARAVGKTRNIPALRAAKIDTYWNDVARTVVWKGALKTYARLSPLRPLAASAKLTNANVIGKLKTQQLVILRGTYARLGGGTGKHWMLATLYTATPTGVVNAVVANDPWTGRQVLIDPVTRRVGAPAKFPLTNFKVDGYQAVAMVGSSL